MQPIYFKNAPCWFSVGQLTQPSTFISKVVEITYDLLAIESLVVKILHEVLSKPDSLHVSYLGCICVTTFWVLLITLVPKEVINLHLSRVSLMLLRRC